MQMNLKDKLTIHIIRYLSLSQSLSATDILSLH